MIMPVIGLFSYISQIITNGFFLNGAILVCLSIFLWYLYLAFYLSAKLWISHSGIDKIDWLLITVFKINALFCLLQYFLLVIEYKTLNPFVSEMSTSAGDNIKGIFANSSVNLVVNAILLYYSLVTKRSIYITVISILIILFTSFMSGIACILMAAGVHFIFDKKISFKKRIGSVLVAAIFISIFYIISYENFIYAYSIIETILTFNPPRKIVSFLQTLDYLDSSLIHFLIGGAPGHFSSRVAFIGGGEYVTWYPSSLTFLSPDFYKNHFQLWNFDTLAIPFNDGTGNQPFSIYNQTLGEYGITGFLCLIFFYFRCMLKKIKKLPYSRFIMILLLLFFFLDYWFEYLSFIIIFEIIILAISSYRSTIILERVKV